MSENRKQPLVRLRKLARSIIALLPKKYRLQQYRNFLKLQYQVPSNLKFRLAKTQEDLEAAFQILHDAYVGAGYMTDHPSGMRATVYHALSATSTLVATWDDKVIGTVSVIRDNAFGLPLEEVFDISSIRGPEIRIAEISALAIHKDFRGRRGEVLLTLQKFLVNYCQEFFGIDRVLASVHPKTVDYYEAIWGFYKFTDQVAQYEYVEGAPASGICLEVKDLYKKLATRYGDKAKEQNLHDFTFETQLENIEFPDRRYFKISDPVMTPEFLSYFFKEKTNVFKNLPRKDLSIIQDLYNSEKYNMIFEEYGLLPKAFQKRQQRFEVQCKGIIIPEGGEKDIPISIVNVSQGGFAAKLDERVPLKASFRSKVAIAEFEVVPLKVQSVWCNDSLVYGFQIEKSKERWERFIAHLKNDLLKGESFGKGPGWKITSYE